MAVDKKVRRLRMERGERWKEDGEGEDTEMDAMIDKEGRQ